MPFTVKNKAPRVQGFNGMSIKFGPTEAPDGSDEKVLTDAEVAVLRKDVTFIALVQKKQMEIVGAKLEAFLGVKPPPPARTAEDNVPEAIQASVPDDGKKPNFAAALKK